jgi:AraC-like DNA-binding protein
VQTVRIHGDRDRPPTYALAPAPGEPSAWVWRFDDGQRNAIPRGRHIHDFPTLSYIETGSGKLSVDGQQWSIRAGDLFVIPPGEVVGQVGTDTLVDANGWVVSFTADALGPDIPGSYLAWRTHPLLFPFVHGGALGALQLSVPPAARPEWTAWISTLHRELTERPDGYREAVQAHLVLLLVGVSRLAADVVGDLRVNREPLLAEVFAVIEERYARPLSLRDVAREVNVSPGHLTSVVRRRTGRTVLEWITERRMVQARRLLATSELPVAEVGRRVGYPDPGYFARVFGRANGTNPARWRDAGR